MNRIEQKLESSENDWSLQGTLSFTAVDDGPTVNKLDLQFLSLPSLPFLISVQVFLGKG